MMEEQDLELTEWLESVAREILTTNPTMVSVVSRRPDGETFTAYYHASAEDKGTSAAHLFFDAMLDVIRNNDPLIREALEEDEDE